MEILTFEQIAAHINNGNVDYLFMHGLGFAAEGYEALKCEESDGHGHYHSANCYEITAYDVYEFMCTDFDNNPESEYRNDNNVTPEMVEQYAKQLSDMQ